MHVEEYFSITKKENMPASILLFDLGLFLTKMHEEGFYISVEKIIKEKDTTRKIIDYNTSDFTKLLGYRFKDDGLEATIEENDKDVYENSYNVMYAKKINQQPESFRPEFLST